ncbi:MAG: hypothetical protein A2902_02085 [Elusimicrobia bacterium RIFCSPLOWO2_01_FULL_64_13]|nr:MAG: hypothetical protein A2902_02085 [Elusimicrobia bacterium RIFCSPLOWO2_01_FULL_64_13]
MSEPILKATGLVKEFASGNGVIRVLDRVDLEIRKGESAAVMGPSGSGKSTLLSLLAGLDRPTEGEVFFGGASLGRMKEGELSRLWGRRIGFIFQSYHLLPALTAEENVRAPLDLAGDRDADAKAREWLAKVGLSDRAGHRPVQLSGGEQQRVALARALSPGPELLFADEPTGNLDARTGREMADLLFALALERGTTLVLVTHEESLAGRTGRIIHLREGRIVPE